MSNETVVEFFRGVEMTSVEAEIVANIYERHTRDHTGSSIIRECAYRVARPTAAVTDRPANPPSTLEFTVEEQLARLNAGRPAGAPLLTEADLKPVELKPIVESSDPTLGMRMMHNKG